MVALRTAIDHHHDAQNQTRNGKTGIIPVQRAGEYFHILFISLFFSMDCSYVLQELKQRPSLLGFAHISEVPNPTQFYRFISKFDEALCIFLTS